MIEQPRSKIYNWLRREKEDRLEDAKPIAKRMVWKISIRKIHEVLKMVKRYPEIATDYVVGIKTGLSPSTVNKIKKGYLAKPVREEDWNIVKKSYGWLKRDVCWSMDTMMVRFMGGWLYVIMVIEELSRMIVGYKIAESKHGIYAKALLLETLFKMNTKPLVVKHDRGREFENKDFINFLEEENIISLPSPGYYAQFNSMLERTNRIMRRFTVPLEMRYDATYGEISHAIARGQKLINNVMPRKIFAGRTSHEIYETSNPYQDSERTELIKLMLDKQKESDGEYFLNGKGLDKQRKEVVEYLCQMNLCQIHYQVNLKKLTG